ncbi:MAG: cobalamin biosynthesis protein CobQ [gamma proteobacterium symbiont of Ctena orbiculata]|nr:MAG: cobalamin biosynthesis protein CobQ [gamma proteobacterium symbiont of Ctena orbiculata]PVV23671.1 MAG: cobalamin biosynthesis protein CobQ [gamma proteobacterium symbiont of Ctena orbiculata]
MKVWTVANQKGGVGKTTTTVSLGGLLSQWGLRTLLVDIDPHGSLTSYFRYDPDALDESVYSLFKAVAQQKQVDPLSLIYPTGTEGLDLMPAEMALATLDRQAGKMDGMGLVIKQALARLQNQYDHVILDCPPILGVLMINALAACEQLIIPVQTEFLALKGLERMLHTLEMVTKSRHIPLPYLVVPTMFDRRTRASIDSLRVMRESYPGCVWHSLIPVDTLFREASKAGIPPALFAPQSRGVTAYEKLLQNLLDEAEEPVIQAGMAT